MPSLPEYHAGFQYNMMLQDPRVLAEVGRHPGLREHMNYVSRTYIEQGMLEHSSLKKLQNNLKQHILKLMLFRFKIQL